MPSLSALRKFKASFDDIGNQKANQEARDIPFDDLEIPAVEPEPMDGLIAAFESSRKDGKKAAPPPPAAEPPDAAPSDDFDFSALLGAQPGDLPP
ncbi:MAG: hypothetical protein FWH38_06320, partial [Treponema sp.]|nr:hypothetical protein [Treponema sp.]